MAGATTIPTTIRPGSSPSSTGPTRWRATSTTNRRRTGSRARSPPGWPSSPIAATSIAVATDASGRPLFVVGARRLDPDGPLELTLEVVGGGRSSWIEAAEVGQQMRLEWSAADQNDVGHVAVALDGRLALWVEGYTGSAKPAGVLLLRAPAPAVPETP